MFRKRPDDPGQQEPVWGHAIATIGVFLNRGLVAALFTAAIAGIIVAPAEAESIGEEIQVATIVCETHDQVLDIVRAHRENGHEASLSVYYAYNHIHGPRGGQACAPYNGPGVVLRQHETVTDLLFDNGHYYQITILHVSLVTEDMAVYVMDVKRMQDEVI